MVQLTDNLTLAIPHRPVTPSPSRQADMASQIRQGVGEFPTVSTTLIRFPFYNLSHSSNKIGIRHHRLNGPPCKEVSGWKTRREPDTKAGGGRPAGTGIACWYGVMGCAPSKWLASRPWCGHTSSGLTRSKHNIFSSFFLKPCGNTESIWMQWRPIS